MRAWIESRMQFNSEMNPYTAVIVQTEHFHFSDEFFQENDLICPQQRIKYIPPSWVGVRYFSEFVENYKNKDILEIPRKEEIPVINPFAKYLICDDYIDEGNTMEIAMERLLKAGVKQKNIWGIIRERGDPLIILDNCLGFYRSIRMFRNCHGAKRRNLLKSLGFVCS